MSTQLHSTSIGRVIVIVAVIIVASIISALLFTGSPISVEDDTSSFDLMQDPIQIDDINIPGITYQTGSLNLIYFPQASYEITAQVMSKKRYRVGWDAKIAPYDFALAWGKLTESAIKKFIKYSQVRRFYFFKSNWRCHLTQNYIKNHSSNNHLIPANKNILNVFRKINKGDIIQLWGYLVNVEGTYKNGDVNWRTSTTREDTGNGACEVIYVDKIRLKNKIYR